MRNGGRGQGAGRAVAGALWVAAVLAAGVAGLRAQPVVPAFERFHAAAGDEAQQLEGGLLLLNELNCVACHAVPAGWRERLPGRGRIRLEGIGARLPEKILAEYLAAPATVEPGTTMPRLAHAGPEADALAAYLVSLPAGTEPRRRFPDGDAARGGKLFASVGCAACHAPPEGPTTYRSVPLGLAPHMERTALAAFILDPLHTRPAGRMPATELSHAEAADLAAYLHAPAQGAAGSVPPPTPGQKPRGDVAAGRGHFAARSCAACHETGEAVPPPARPARALAELTPGRGCLAEAPDATVPDFALGAGQRQALGAALRAVRAQAQPPVRTAEQRVTAKFEQLNCYACHEWRGRGGAEPARAKHFIVQDSGAESLGEMGHLPPKLDHAGRKLTPAWLAKLLWGEGGGVRPYMSARMPRYGEVAAGDLPAALAEACRPAKPQEIDVSGSLGHQRFATGMTLLGTGAGGLGCVACHGLKQREPNGVRAINLTHTAQRLRPEFFKALLLDPHGIQPGTIMPPLFAGRKTADKEIESIWTYFKELDQSELLPEGLALPGSFELKPAAEGRPIVFRTFMEGAGTQAIAVGFPAGVHAAFDAYEVRWALLWRGRFLDAQTNWEERPMKPIKPLGDAVRMTATHVPLARLRAAGDAWPTSFGARAGYRFHGYRIDAEGVPTFRYETDGLQVDDTLRPGADGASLRRTLTIRSGTGGGEGATWFFRGLGDGVGPRPLAWRDGVATVEETLTFSP